MSGWDDIFNKKKENQSMKKKKTHTNRRKTVRIGFEGAI